MEDSQKREAEEAGDDPVLRDEYAGTYDQISAETCGAGTALREWAEKRKSKE